MNNAGTVLLTIADMSVIETEIEVDETDVPHVQVGQTAKIEIDAFPDRRFPGTSHGSRQQSDRRDGSGRLHPGPGDELQGRRADRRRGSGRAAGLHVHRHDHDGHAQECARRADSGHDRPRARRGRRRARSCRPKRRPGATAPNRPTPPAELEARSDPQGDRRRVRHADRHMRRSSRSRQASQARSSSRFSTVSKRATR